MMVLFIINGAEPASQYIPPPLGAPFSAMKLFTIVGEEFEQNIPPPLPALFAMMILPFMVGDEF